MASNGDSFSKTPLYEIALLNAQTVFVYCKSR